MKRARLSLSCLLFVGLTAPAAADEPTIVDVIADPPTVTLTGPTARWSMLVHGKTADGQWIDLTRRAHYRSLTPKIAEVSNAGIVRPVADGTAKLVVEAEGKELPVTVVVSGAALPRQYHFENDIEPLLSRYACNMSGCHGKAEGQNGFKLSVFGFDPQADYDALVREARGRRIFPADPERSLLLSKASGGVAHGGGVKIAAGSEAFETIRGWIAAGVPFGNPDAPKVARLRVEPTERTMAMKSRQQLRVIATLTDGREADITRLAKFMSNSDAIAGVDANGLVTAGEMPGDAAVMATYMGAFATFRVLVPRPEPIANYPTLPTNNFIDPLVYAKLRKLNVLPSEGCDDAEYLRRVSLDVIGTLPTPAEARAFLADRSPDKREKLVDALLKRPEFADYWALKWADTLRVDRATLGHRRAYGYFRWVRDSLAANKPLDEFAREVLTAEGPLDEVGPANFYKVAPKPGEAASLLMQVFLGVRIACAECHHHPFDRWGQTDYYGMQAYFNPVSVKGSPVGGEMLAVAGEAMAINPRTREPIRAAPLGHARPEPPGVAGQAKPPAADRRSDLAGWITAPDNPWFARNLANRVWAHFLGRGLVEPLDDFRDTNPPTNPELLDALATHLIESKYDLRALIKAVVGSRTYQTSTKPNATNEKDERNYSRFPLKRVDAEVLLDMVSQATGVPEKFAGIPPGSRAIQLWDSKVPHYFLKIFGRPQRVTACTCERQMEPNVAQVLHVLNAPEIQAKLSHEKGTVARLVRTEPDNGKLVEELYLTFFSRPPSEAERAVAVSYLGRKPSDRRGAAEDLAWSLLNSLEFVFNH